MVGRPAATAAEYRTRVLADRQKSLNMMKVPHERMTREAATSNKDPLPPAACSRQTANLQLWCEFNSWQICSQCKTIQPRELTPQGMSSLLSPWCTKSACIFCRNRRPHPELKVPEACLLNLPQKILEAIAVVTADFGPVLESKDRFGRGNGYRFHAKMVTFSWQLSSVEARTAALTAQERVLAEAALEWLWEHTGPGPEDTAFGDFWSAHEEFLTKHPSPDPRQAKRWLRFIESEGLETVLWPHIFTQRKQCLTWARLQGTARQARGAFRSTLAERMEAEYPAEEGEEEAPADVVSCKRHYMALLLSPLLDVSLSYDILHFSYDLQLWSDLGSKRNLQLGVPMRLMLRNHSFSSEYWKDMHRGLVDLTKQKGFPPVFSTHSPLEWSWPTHLHIVKAMEQGRRGGAQTLCLSTYDT